jgi:pyroglutamyl-peptidase
MRQRTTILLTGFGPFPGVPENASARLVPKLADLAARRFPGHRVVARLLPTEWAAGPDRIAAIYAREKPRLALHFGVSAEADGFVIETLARNIGSRTKDAKGASCGSQVLLEDGPEALDCGVPAREIVDRLTALDIPASLSHDAGAYLCNAVLYKALSLSAEAVRGPRVGFVHIPVALGRQSARRFGLTASEDGLDWESALAGGLEIIRVCLGRPAPARRPGRSAKAKGG